MNYTQKYFNEIFESMLNDSLQKGLISHAEEFESYIKNQEDISNYYVLDKAVIAQMVSTIYEDITNVYNSINVDIATGADLDNLGMLVGIARPTATHAMCEVTFTSTTIFEEEIRIPSGILVSSPSGIQYRTLEEVYIPVGGMECIVPAISVLPGTSYKVVENMLTIIELDSYNLTCTNTASSGGTDEYTDLQYRELIKKWQLIHLKGSAEAFEYYFSTFDGIDGYRLVPNWDVSGTLKIILDPGLPIQLNQAFNEIKEKIAQIDTDITMFAPTEKFIDVYVTVNVDIDRVNPYSGLEKETIKTKIESSVKLFIDGGYKRNGEYYGGLQIGEDFIPHKLAVFLDEEVPEIKNISFNYPSDFIEILDDEKGVSNNITIEMI